MFQPNDSPIVKTATDVLQRIIDAHGNQIPGRLGGYLCVVQRPTGILQMLRSIGMFTDSSFALSCEKEAVANARSLLKYPDALSTWAIRNPPSILGGGIALPAWDINVSFCGLDEVGNEAGVLISLVELGLLNSDTVRPYLAISYNALYRQLAKLAAA
ncbi:hypothetical protein KKG41_00490 [Patescibacteria group bacterium]|nr:hypothetical protein [Patescibacteria group bacterium]